MIQPRFHRWWPALFGHDRHAGKVRVTYVTPRSPRNTTELDDLIQYWRDSYAMSPTFGDRDHHMRVAATIYYLQVLQKEAKE